jgi:hypothetical protein
MIAESGNIFTKDEYDQFYDINWETVRGDLDITTVTKTPYVWGEVPSGFIRNGILFRRGIISVQRQIIRVLDNGYEIIAEGASQYEDYIQMNFPCEEGPSDPFAYHVNCGIIDEPILRVTDGSRWADPDESGDSDAIWGDLEDDGSPVGDLTGTGGLNILEWIDIWPNL